MDSYMAQRINRKKWQKKVKTNDMVEISQIFGTTITAIGVTQGIDFATTFGQ